MSIYSIWNQFDRLYIQTEYIYIISKNYFHVYTKEVECNVGPTICIMFRSWYNKGLYFKTIYGYSLHIQMHSTLNHQCNLTVKKTELQFKSMFILFYLFIVTCFVHSTGVTKIAHNDNEFRTTAIDSPHVYLYQYMFTYIAGFLFLFFVMSFELLFLLYVVLSLGDRILLLIVFV